jgi:hypothetical protein
MEYEGEMRIFVLIVVVLIVYETIGVIVFGLPELHGFLDRMQY